MKFNLVGSLAGLALGVLVFASPVSLQAGWGILHAGGSSGYSSYGGSSGYSAAYASGGSSGYSAAYASGGSSGYVAYSSVGGSSGGSSGGPGLLQRVANRIHSHLAAKHAYHAARRAAYGSSGYASSGGSSGYYSYSSYGGGSSGGVSYGSTGVSYGSTGVSYGSVGSVYHGASTNSGYSPASSLASNVDNSSDAVYLTVVVPSDAKVFVNENETTSTGAVRKFVSHGLKPGMQYSFQVRAELTAADGSLMSEEKTLVVSAGQQEQLHFAFAENASPIETAVTLNVPEGAKVLLAGNETKASGQTRTFRTSRLKPGQVWDDYEIEVQFGEIVKRRSIRLIAGDNLQLSFDFDQATDKVAAL